MTPFTFVDAILKSKEDIMVDDLSERAYVPYIVNRALSHRHACIALVNEINQYPDIPKRLQFHFLLNSIRRNKVFVPWIKAEKVADLEVIQEYYQCNTQKAEAALQILTTDQIKIIRKKLQKGGVK